MPGIDMVAVIKSLSDSEAFTDDQIGLLEAAGEELLTYGEDEFTESMGMTRLEALAARGFVRDAFGAMGVTENVRFEIPQKPPYLTDPGSPQVYGETLDDGTRTVKKAGDKGDYNPEDPMQFAKIGDQFFRWDGQRNEHHPYGEPHEITFIHHTIVRGVPVPEAKQVEAALAANLGWWHKAYKCWISGNGKRSVEVPRETLTDVRNVIGSRTPMIAQ